LANDVLELVVDGELAVELAKLDISKGLPLLDLSALSPAPPATVGHVRAKFGLSTPSVNRRLPPLVPKSLVGTRIFPLLKNDKKRVLPDV
jgi:hypothetical protein